MRYLFVVIAAGFIVGLGLMAAKPDADTWFACEVLGRDCQ